MGDVEKIVEKVMEFYGIRREFDWLDPVGYADALIGMMEKWLDESFMDYKTGMALCRAFEEAVESLSFELEGRFKEGMLIEVLRMAVQALHRPYHPSMADFIKSLLPELKDVVEAARRKQEESLREAPFRAKGTPEEPTAQ